jgi:hypothetical protein
MADEKMVELSSERKPRHDDQTAAQHRGFRSEFEISAPREIGKAFAVHPAHVQSFSERPPQTLWRSATQATLAFRR